MANATAQLFGPRSTIFPPSAVAPFELPRHAAFDAKALTAMVRVFAEARADLTFMFVQRVGSSRNLNARVHVIARDGVFVRMSGTENANVQAAPRLPRTRTDTARLHA